MKSSVLKFCKKLSYIFLIFIFASLSFMSCENAIIQPSIETDQENTEENLNTGAVSSIIVKGKFDFEGRSAMPVIPGDSELDYYLYAKKNGTTKKMVRSSDSDSKNYINLETKSYAIEISTNDLTSDEIEWTFVLEAKIKNSNTQILIDTYKSWLSEGMSIFVHDFVLKPTTGGSGKINLSMTVPTTVSSVEAVCDNTNWTSTNPSITVTSGIENNTVSLSSNSITGGVYSVRFNFKDSTGLLLYSDKQTINVLNGCETKTWQSNGASGPITNGSYTVTSTMLEAFQFSTFYVGKTLYSDSCGSVANGYTGSPAKPLNNLADVVSIISARPNSTSATYTIIISGRIIGCHSITNAVNSKAASITLCGASAEKEDDGFSPKHKLDGNGEGTTLTIGTSVPVVIENLLITGGSNANGNGGGIAITNGNVELTTGAVVNGNTAKVGGGVCLSGGSLYLNKSAVVGNPSVSECAKNQDGKYGNKATVAGGGISVLTGTLWIGYIPGSTPAEADTSGGVFYNLVANNAACHGGGIDNNNGTLKICKGKVSYNYAYGSGSGDGDVGSGGGISTSNGFYMSGEAEVSNNKSAYGGGVYITKDSSNGSFSMSGGTIKSNNAEQQNSKGGNGGGVAIGADGTFTMSGGEISSNEAASSGGAVYHHGSSFEITGTTAKIIAGSGAKDNDIGFWPADGFYIKVSGSTGHTGTDSDKILVTPGIWTRGNQVLGGTGTSYFDRFKITDNEWKIVTHDSKGKLDADIWVASSGSNTGRASTVSAPPESGRLGTKSKPYATIAEAVSQVWDDGSTKTLDFTINISGSISGNQTIANTVTNAKSITLLGDANATKKELNAGNSGTVLTISSTVLITIQNLTITGGNKTGDGGGINMQADNAKLTLTEGAVITANNSSGNGGGIYFGGASGKVGLLKMNSTASISGNTATGNGGGLYMSYANLCMSGTAMIGDTTASVAMSDAKSNSAANGGGVYCSDGQIWLGYSAASTSSTSALTAGYGVCRNYASGSGGGIYNHMSSFANNRSVVYLNTGSISFNQANSSSSSGNGGGIFNENSIHMSGGEIKGNYSYAGAGIYNTKPSGSNWVINVYFSGGIIGNYASTNAKPNSATNGAGVYNGSGCNLCMSGTAVIGYIDNSITSAATQEALKCANIAQNGSGVYNEGSIYFGYTGVGNNYKDNDFSGGIHYNFAQISGGGIYNKGTVQMHKGVISFNGTFGNGGGVYNDVTADDKFLMNGGSIEKNETLSNVGYGGALYLVNTTNTPFVLTGGAAIPSTGTKKKNDIYLDGSATIKINDADYSPGTTTKNMWITPSVYSARQVVAGTETIVAKAFKYFYATKENTSDTVPKWAVNNSGNLFSAYVVSGASAITPDKLTAGTDYTFVFPEDMGDYGLACAFQQLFGGGYNSDAPLPESIPALGSGTVIDLSRLSITEFAESPYFSSSETKKQTINKVILPATLTAEAFSKKASIHICFMGVQTFEVDDSAENIKCYGGAVYNSDYTKLLCYPGASQTFVLHSSTTEIAPYACCSIQNTSSDGITIPDRIKKIGNNAFNYSTIKKITFPTNTNFTEIPESCCRMCISLASVTIPSNVKTISTEAFWRCVITNLTLPSSGLQTIGEKSFCWAFSTSANLTVNIPSSVTRIGKGAFVDNTSANLIISLAAPSGWAESETESGPYLALDTDVTSADLKNSSSLGAFWLKK